MSELDKHWDLDPDAVFLNHGSFGACPRVVLETQRELRARLERQPVLFMARDLQGLLDEARGRLADLVGADSLDLAFVPNATHGFNTVLRSIPLAAGDELILTSHGYNAARTAAEYVAGRVDAKVNRARVPFPIQSPDQVLDAVLEQLTERTRLVLIDHVTSPTGLVFPVARVVEAMAERGVDVLVDGAHAPGMLDLDLNALGAAYYTGNCHKWLCAPKGAAFLHVRRDKQRSVRPLAISHGADRWIPEGSTRFRQEFDWTGTADPTAFLCIPHAIDAMAALVPGGWPEVRQRNHDLVVAGREIVCQALGVDPPAPKEMLGSLASVSLPPSSDAADPDPAQAALWDQHRIEVPAFPFPAPPERLLRLSAQLYNTREQYEHLARVLPGVLE